MTFVRKRSVVRAPRGPSTTPAMAAAAAASVALAVVAGTVTASAAPLPGSSLPGSGAGAGSTGATTCTVAIDPGHNGVETNTVDPETGVLMADYPNGREDADVLDVATTVKQRVEAAGFRAVLLKDSVADNVTYRERVDRATDAGAVMGVSVHSTPGAAGSAIFPQRDGGSRTGTGEDGQPHTVTFDNAGVAAESERMSTVVAGARSLAERRNVQVTDNSFDERPGLWGGNLPVISLIADVPWIYSEYGSATGGGAHGITAQEKTEYANGLGAGIVAALATSRECSPLGSVQGSMPGSS